MGTIRFTRCTYVAWRDTRPRTLRHAVRSGRSNKGASACSPSSWDCALEPVTGLIPAKHAADNKRSYAGRPRQTGTLLEMLWKVPSSGVEEGYTYVLSVSSPKAPLKTLPRQQNAISRTTPSCQVRGSRAILLSETPPGHSSATRSQQRKHVS